MNIHDLIDKGIRRAARATQQGLETSHRAPGEPIHVAGRANVVVAATSDHADSVQNASSHQVTRIAQENGETVEQSETIVSPGDSR